MVCVKVRGVSPLSHAGFFYTDLGTTTLIPILQCTLTVYSLRTKLKGIIVQKFSRKRL